jgi:hypothetical protein
MFVRVYTLQPVCFTARVSISEQTDAAGTPLAVTRKNNRLGAGGIFKTHRTRVRFDHIDLYRRTRKNVLFRAFRVHFSIMIANDFSTPLGSPGWRPIAGFGARVPYRAATVKPRRCRLYSYLHRTRVRVVYIYIYIYIRIYTRACCAGAPFLIRPLTAHRRSYPFLPSLPPTYSINQSLFYFVYAFFFFVSQLFCNILFYTNRPDGGYTLDSVREFFSFYHQYYDCKTIDKDNFAI